MRERRPLGALNFNCEASDAMIDRVLKTIIFLSFALMSGAGAQALESAPVTTPHATVTLVSNVDGFEPGQAFRLGLRFKMAKGWHIYWRNPGEAGEPPHLDLTLPPGATASEIDWPTPFRIPEGPVMTYSYEGEVTLPLTVSPPEAPAPLTIDARASWLICEKICIPEEGTLRLAIASGTATPSAQAPLFRAADQRIPRPSPYPAKLTPDAMLVVSGEGIAPNLVKEVSFFPDNWGSIEDAAPQLLKVEEGRFSLALKPAQGFDPHQPLPGVLCIKDAGGQERFLAITATPTDTRFLAKGQVAGPAPFAGSAAPAASKTAADMGLATLLLFAFLGGLILNLMPCVFPILAVKAVSIAGLSGHERGRVRSHAAAYTAGVLVSFAGLGTLLLLLKAAGAVVGWGFQFQSPVFVGAMAFLFLLIGLNLSGVFEIGGSFVGAGTGLASRGGLAGSFFTGFLAVLVATPCTAPFMGVAISAALAASAAATITILLALGLGLAAPYLAFAFIPGLVRLLPKPGAWMAILKQALAFPMYASAAWLLWVISQEAGPDGVLAVSAGFVLIGLAAWALGVTQGRQDAARLYGQAVAALAALCAVAFLLGVETGPASIAAASEETQPYSPSRLAALRTEGRPVFVNLTAAWCVTCKINERVALASDAVRQAFAARHIAYLKGDWTRPDPAISALLHEHGRDGVPLYLFYPARGGEPIVLPQLLTSGIVLDALGRAGS
ncbi:MAG TPA: protein-disulfide reductase DsbD domain-containing protein [Methylocella sp.]|nr:protein-disulfide reductase DsbD domain-containing protein [Methylocella sp.]